jgi:PAS domain S-box-containing protein
MDEDELKRENERLRSRVAELEARAGALDAHALRAVFEGTPDALLLIDNTAVYVDANPAACELFAMKREEIVGAPVGSLTKKQGVDVPPALALAAGRRGAARRVRDAPRGRRRAGLRVPGAARHRAGAALVVHSGCDRAPAHARGAARLRRDVLAGVSREPHPARDLDDPPRGASST